MSMSNLHDVVVDLIKDLYHAEKQLVAALPKMARAASSDQLRTAFENHLDQTRGHVDRLERAFGMLEMKPTAKLCHAMKGLVEEGKEVIEERKDSHPAAIDAALIAAAQKVEHYEISAYGTLMAFAQTLGMNDLAKLLKSTLDEEEAADEKLTDIAEGAVNARAAAGEADDEGSPPAVRKKPARSRRA